MGNDAHTRLLHSLKGTAANVAEITQTHHLFYGEDDDVFGDSGQRRALTDRTIDRMRHAAEKAKVRARGEHPFHVVKNPFGHRNVRYRGAAENEAQLYALFGLANPVLAQRRMPALQGRGAS